MKTETFEATAEQAYGKKLDTPVKYSGTFEKYESINEVRNANDMLKDDEVVKVRNAERKSTARQAALTAALDLAGIVKPTIENDEQLRLVKMYDILIAAKKSDAEARAIASATLGIEWATE